MTPEHRRLEEARLGRAAWRRWGPYLSERQWGTVREDYSPGGDAWAYFPHDHARSRAYRWGEDGLAGISDDAQRLCFALALWNGKDPLLKERLFGLTNGEGNHGEDVKEYYHYIDCTPTHSYMKWLYRYPQAAFPYHDLVETNRRRSRSDLEYELLDTGVFDEDRYFDVVVEYAKPSPEELVVLITVHNRGPEAAELHVLPTLWFRDVWSWHRSVPPSLAQVAPGVVATDGPAGLGRRWLVGAPDAPLLFTNNDTNRERLFGVPNRTPYVKDGVDRFVVHGDAAAVNPARAGTKVAAHHRLRIPSGGSQQLRLWLTDVAPGASSPAPDVEAVVALRRREADEFYTAILPPGTSPDAALVMRQAFAGMLWGKQYYHYDLHAWLEEHGADPLAPLHRAAPRNDGWHHMHNADVISMPDKWEYPWYAAWDLAFHAVALAGVDLDLAKSQLSLVLGDRYLHPNGQLPAYEWNFSDVNPPVHAWATMFTYRIERRQRGRGDLLWLERSFQKLLLNFTWWVNRKDRDGRNVFQGGFLGLDNIGVFDRSAPLPGGGHLEQADGTAWMALFSQNMVELAVELLERDGGYIDMVLKFVEHFLWIASAMANAGMWDEADGFYYDVLRHPDGRAQPLAVRSLVGVLPLCATTVFEPGVIERFPQVAERFREFVDARPALLSHIHDLRRPGVGGRRLLSVLDEPRLRRVLATLLDERELLGPFGIRSLSRRHLSRPFEVVVNGQPFRVEYRPAESDSGMFGGNSNWRGPVWMPMNALIIRALLHYFTYFGEDLRVECPTGSGRRMNLFEVAQELTRRLASLFLRGPDGRRPVFGGARKFQEDPGWRDHLLFYEYFHGDDGAGLGASHQTGWTGLIAQLMRLMATWRPEDLLRGGLDEQESLERAAWTAEPRAARPGSRGGP